MSYSFLIHDDRDDVGVAVRDVKSGEQLEGIYQKSPRAVTLTALQDIPLGHKIALVDRNAGEQILKYGEVIGAATEPIKVGQHVHVHNIKSVRWG